MLSIVAEIQAVIVILRVRFALFTLSIGKATAKHRSIAITAVRSDETPKLNTSKNVVTLHKKIPTYHSTVKYEIA